MLTTPQAYYDNVNKQALGYQNPFYLKKAQRVRPNLYDGTVISKPHVVLSMIDDEETLILEEESRSKMSEKLNDPEAIKKNIKIKPIDSELESKTPVETEVPFELPKVSLVNTSLKHHLADFDKVVQVHITPSALTEGAWGFEHTKSVFINEVIPF
ncbi:hypothetical protein Tco_0530241 [Tanacetum coccineum]